MSPVTAAIIDYLERNPAASNEEVAEHVRRTVPGSSTTAASVSSVKSRLKSGHVSLGQAALSGRSPLTAPFQPPEAEEETDEEALSRITVRYAAYRRHCRK